MMYNAYAILLSREITLLNMKEFNGYKTINTNETKEDYIKDI